ncbi:hypothetical protein [Methanosarcina sp. 1.H.T.1A.1]|uniref:hypothetical protein n=1 Tax=Methanosarcina sp. 1.H.T.1A.1 TaxID=1483602 RepID=UPI0012E01E1F|nr:hypothetical protein [Methanosarcina sp. 1.H.T.1A.1]
MRKEPGRNPNEIKSVIKSINETPLNMSRYKELGKRMRRIRRATEKTGKKTTGHPLLPG